ncbi:hypothetical protein C6503_17000 [Candidatus Poribacteria bacterium]|nr:MAG: hypothetical protein C6503_17000 [Candidatus Poribacteria bacterium]
MWKALDRNTGHPINWECSGRDKKTLEKLTTRLAAFNVTTYYTDKWHVYPSVVIRFRCLHPQVHSSCRGDCNSHRTWRASD